MTSALQGLLRWSGRELDKVSTGGWLLGLVFFTLALTPSLIPRNYVTQGFLCGFTFAAGYGIGVFLEWLWDYLGLRWPNKRLAEVIGRATVLVCLGFAIAFLWYSTGWQNSIRAVMGMAPVASIQPLYVVSIAILPAALLIGIGSVLVFGVRLVSHWLGRIIPPRVALVGAMLAVGLLTATIGEGVIGRGLLQVADRFYGNLDRLVGINEPAPTNPLQSGSAQSFIPWDTIGRDARVYVQTGPTAKDIADMTGKPAIEPLRVYVGLRAAETAQQRADLALKEMDRVGAFDRSVLVIIMPVGTGWVEPSASDTLEFLQGGDVATVAVQYSYLTSALSLVVEADVGLETAQATFKAIYARWTAMPKDTRPKLYLHGLSLGAYGSVSSAPFYDILGDPPDGALWAGTPFASPTWRSLTVNRDPGSPWWLPSIGNGSTVRFSNGGGDLATDTRIWGPMRSVFLQYPSDPIVFFEPAMLWRAPAWLSPPRADTVSPLLDWYPVVTFLQVGLDMALAQTGPIGFGHNYSPEDYLDAWVTVTQPKGWSEADLATLRQRLARKGQLKLISGGWFRIPKQD